MSTRISPQFVQDLLAKADIVSLVQERITLKKTGANYGACCPFHQEKTPSFTVSPSKQFYHCFGCHAHGNAIGFLMAYDRLSFVEAIEFLARSLGVAIPTEFIAQKAKTESSLYPLLEKISQYYQAQLEKSEKVLSYLNGRGISKEMIQKFSLGFAPPGWDNVLRQFGHSNVIKAQLVQTGMLIKNAQERIYDRFKNRLMIPIRDQRGRLIAFGSRALSADESPKYMNSPQTPLFDKGTQFFGLYEARQTKTLDFCLIVEGYMDVIALHQFGITQAVGTMGTATNTQNLRHLLRYTKDLVFCFDGDGAGKEAAWRALENSLPILDDGIQIRFMFLDKEHDPDSMIREIGAAAFQARIQDATPISDFLFLKLSDGVDLKNPAGKAKLASLLKPLLKQIPDNIFKTLITQQLAAQIGMTMAQIEIHLAAKESLVSVSVVDEAPEFTLFFPIERAITLLLQYPHLAQTVHCPDALRKIQMPGVATWVKLFDQLQEDAALSTGALLEKWRGAKAETLLYHLAAQSLMIPVTGMSAELSGAIARILEQDKTDKVQILLEKQASNGLTREEASILMQLWKDRQDLKKRH